MTTETENPSALFIPSRLTPIEQVALQKLPTPRNSPEPGVHGGECQITFRYLLVVGPDGSITGCCTQVVAVHNRSVVV